ncbi:MAG: DUF3467 domain-containing protein [Rikenellaceae bacterium]
MSDKDQQDRRDVELDLSEEIAQGRYANLAIISHSPTEFILDFASMLPGMPKPKVNNRVILTPDHAKRLFQSLQDNLTRYETKYGAITGSAAGMQSQSQDDPFAILNTPKIGEA